MVQTATARVEISSRLCNDNEHSEKERTKIGEKRHSLIDIAPFGSADGFGEDSNAALLLLLLFDEERFCTGFDMLFPMPKIKSLFRSAMRGMEMA